MHVRDAVCVVHDGAVGCLFIRMSWEDNMDDEVVVGRMILDDFGISNSVNRKKETFCQQLIHDFSNTKIALNPLLWALKRIGRTASSGMLR